MSTAAYASDGSATESEDESACLQVKLGPTVNAVDRAIETSVVVKSEVSESHEDEELKQEVPILKTIEQQEEEQEDGELKQELPILQQEGQEEGQEDETIPPCCSACGYPLLVVPQTQILKAKEMLDCKCCNLVLPDTSYSKTQRSKELRKCIACTGNVNRGAKPLVKPTREKPKPEKPSRTQSKKAATRSQEASAVFTNKVGRLKMARGALQRKRDEANKLKMTKRREEYEQQLNKEEKDLERQAALLKRENPSAYQNLMKEIAIKKPPTYKQEMKQNKKKKASAEKRKAKRKADETPEQAKKKRKGPVVDSSVYVQSASADEVPARVIPIRSRARSQPETSQSETVSVKSEVTTVNVKSEVKTELPKVEAKTE